MPIDQQLNVILKEMWRIDEKDSRGEALSPEERSFYNEHLGAIARYYRENDSYWNEKKPI